MKKQLSVFCSLLMVMQLILSTVTLPAMAAEGDGTEGYIAPESPAVMYNMNIDWSFKKASGDAVYPLIPALESAKDASGKYFYDPEFVEDETWEKVSVPHAPNSEEQFMNLGVDAGDSDVWRGFMFYRKEITIPQTDASKYFIEFEAFRQSVYLYVNGHIVGYYEAGVAPVGFDITDYVTPGEKAVVAVATDNSASRGNNNDTKETIFGSKIPDITPLADGDTYSANNGYGYQWNTKDFNEVQGGLTGNVNLYAKGSVYQTLPLYNNLKTTGNYIYGSNFDLNRNSADINVEAEVRNESGTSKDITLEVNVVDKDGNVAATFSKTQNVAAATDTDSDQFLSMVPENAYNEAGEGQENNNVDISTVDVTKIVASQNVADLKFWSDVSPNLYDVYTILKDGDTVIDVDKTTTGFREVKYDKDNGLQINGQTTYLKGYAQRSTNEWAAIGVANDWLTDIDMQLIKESNANFIRWMHIAPNPVDIRGGDKYGVISVVPAGDKEGDASGRAWDQRVEAMRDVIIYFRNSPSAMFWEAGNNAITPAHMKEMTDLRKALAPSSDTRMGCRTISSNEQIAEAEWAGTMLYRNDAAAYAAMGAVDNYIPILETEYHRNESPRRVWDDFTGPYYDYVNKWLGSGGSKTDGFDIWNQTQEDFSRTMFNGGDGYSYYYNNRVGGTGKNYYSGAAMMVWSDSNMHVRNCGVENCRTSGRVDPIRVKKESFYAIQAAQSTTPKIHILGHWNYPKYIKGDEDNGNYWYYVPKWNGKNFEISAEKLQRDPTDKSVYVIGSAQIAKIELYVNGELVGTDEKADDNYIYEFPHIDVTQSGEVRAKAYNEREELVDEHFIKTVGEPATIRLTPVYGPDSKLRADGSDLMYIDVEVIDAEGNVCPTDERKISFSLSGNTDAAKFIGGYNSGYYGNYNNAQYNEPGGRIVNHKDYVFAECGINRVFVQSTREAGNVTLTATAENMQPVSVTISSEAFETENGLTTVPQQSFAQGEVPDPPKKEKAPVLKALGEEFTADWTETTGNVIHATETPKDYYKVMVNDTEVTLTDRAYKPDSSTGVVGEISKILDAMIAAGVDVSYEYKTTGDLPQDKNGIVPSGSLLPYTVITAGTKVIHVINGSTNLLDDGEQNLMNFMPVPNSTGEDIICELGAVIGLIDGVNVSTSEEEKTITITTDTAQPETASYSADFSMLGDKSTEYPAAMVYTKGNLTITAKEKIENAVLLIAGYDKNGALTKLLPAKTINLESDASAVEAIDEEIRELTTVKAMLWNSLEEMKPIAETVRCENVYKIDEVYEYDTVQALNECNEAIADTVLSDDNAPDGTKYITVADGKEIKAASLDGDSTADIMWSVDVRFNNDGSSIIPRNKANNYGTCVLRHDQNGTPKIALQTGSTSFTHYETIDPTAWYHLVLIGRYSAPDARTDMILYKYENGEKVLVARHDNVNQRNLSANSKAGAQYWYANAGISIDNAQITVLGADKLKVTSDADEIKAGNVMPFDYSATRQNNYITKPAVKWEVYDEANENVLNPEDSGISINENGILSVGLDAASQMINVRATATIKDGLTISASKAIEVEAIDISSVKFDALTLTTEDAYVKAGEPMTINVTATKNGETVTLEDEDLIWYATDSTDLYTLGADYTSELAWIKIVNGVVTVDERAVSQDITIRAADPEDKVRGSIAIHVKSSDALEDGEDGALDKLLTADNCEAPIANANLVESIDGTHAYQATALYQTAAISETASDIVVEMDIRFDKEGAGFQPAKSGKINTCVISHNGKFSVQTGGSAYDSFATISPTKWYHITLIRKKGAYAHIVLEEYDENGNRQPVATYKDVNQRNNENTAFININPGTSYDNLRILTPAPTDITINTDVTNVFAGGKVQATSALFWNDLEMKNPDATTFEYKIYDAENKYPVAEDAKITVDAEGVISVDAMTPIGDYHVRAIAKASGKYASKKFTVNSSDIIEMKQLGVSEDETKLVNLLVDKRFFYDKEITFVVQVYEKQGQNRGETKASYVKQMFGDALPMGESSVSLGFDLPADFNKETDEIKIYAVTRVFADVETEADANMTVSGGTLSSVASTQIQNIPSFDNDATVLVMALKAGADETDVKAEDILYFDQIKSGDIVDNTLTIRHLYEIGMTVKLSGNINGVHTVVKGICQ